MSMSLFLVGICLKKICLSSMVTFWIVFALVALIAFGITAYNIVDGVKKQKKEMERMEYLDNSEYDYGHNVKHE